MFSCRFVARIHQQTYESTFHLFKWSFQMATIRPELKEDGSFRRREVSVAACIWGPHRWEMRGLEQY